MTRFKTAIRFASCLIAVSALTPGAFATSDGTLEAVVQAAAGEETDTRTVRQTPGADTITVYSRVPQSLDQVGSAASLFTAEDIELQDLRVLDDVLQRLPGVAVTRSGGFGQNTQVRMRGFTTKHTLILVDGVRMNNPSEFSNQFGISHVMLDMIERVEVLRGPQSGLYGAEAVAGVISITTKRGRGEPDFRLMGGYGTHNTVQAGIGSQGEIGDFGYAASVSFIETDGISIASRAPGNVEDDGYRNTTASFNLDYRPREGLELRSGVRFAQAVNETDNAFLFGDPVLPNFLFQDSEGYIDSDQLIVNAGFTADSLGGRLIHDGQIAYTRLDSLSEAPASASDSVGERREIQYFATWQFDGAGPYLGSESFFLAGVNHTSDSAQFRSLRGAPFAAIDESVDNLGVYANFNWQIAEDLFLSLSGRHDENELFGGVRTGRAAVSWGVPQSLTGEASVRLRASYGTGREAPSLRQLLGQSATFQGNPDLLPEETWMVDAGIDLISPGGGYSLSVTGYIGEADNGIFSVFNPALGVSSPQNIASVVEMDGIEVEAGAQLTDWLDLTLAYTNARSVIAATGVQLFGRPEHEFSFAFTARATERLNLTFDGYARSDFLSDFPSTFEMPGFELFNASVRYQLNDAVTLQGAVKNILDTEYEYKLGDGTYGRTFDVRISVRF
ncbi:TonB-dependent receptor [Hyphomonadaceae bacterium BL14]|nr:TonB-dependent receptor [Hyphomonadaceae bacterium BL14]